MQLTTLCPDRVLSIGEIIIVARSFVDREDLNEKSALIYLGELENNDFLSFLRVFFCVCRIFFKCFLACEEKNRIR